MVFGRYFWVAAGAVFLLVPAGSVAHAQTLANFVGMTPCRIADTRDPRYSSTFGPPYMPAKSTRDFPILSSPCGVPSTAVAYSVNVTVVPHGPLPYLTMWPTGQSMPEVSTLNAYSGAVVANAAVVPAGNNGSVSIYVDGETDVLIDINGYFVQYVAPTIPAPVNTTIVQQVTLPTILPQTNAGSQNTGIGSAALGMVAGGIGNTALGVSALAANTGGNNNVAIGSYALANNVSGHANIAIGPQALFQNGLQDGNIAIGFNSLSSSVNGYHNTAVGVNTLSTDNRGSNNIAIGYEAGINVVESNNIEIGNAGDSTDAFTIRIGTQGTQSRTFIAGITSNIVGVSGVQQVYINSTTGQLGIQPSSQRYKEDIESLSNESDKLMELRPVHFRYKQPAEDGSKPLQYGLIAEEVAQVYPELVVRDQSGQIEAVQYQMLPALLIKQLQKQQATIAELQRRLEALESALATRK